MGEAALPFVGRAVLLERVRRLLLDGRNIVLQGAAGVGKTRLAGEALHPGAGGAVDRLLADEGRADVLLGALAPVGPPASVAVEDQTAVFGWFVRHWRARGTAGRPALVWVDDIHHCDPLSAAILRHAVATGAVQLLATHRLSEPLGGAALSMLTEGLLHPVAVEPLARPAADSLARAAMRIRPVPARLDPPTLERLHELAAGNPLFVRELVAGLTTEVDLRSSTTLVTMVERPLHRLSASPRRTLEIVAVAEPAPERLLVSRWTDLHLLENEGLVLRREGTVQVDHPLRRAWLRRDIGAALPEVLADLLDLVETAGCRGEIDTTRLIEWQLQAGRPPDPGDLEHATRLAIARRDGSTAMRFADAVRGPVGPLLRGHALVTLGRLEEGLDVLAQATSDGPPAVRAEAAFARAGYIGLMLGDSSRAHAALDAVDDPAMPATLRRHVVSGRLWLWIFGPVGDEQALRLAREMALEGPDDALAFELSHGVAAVLLHVAGDPGDLTPLMARCADLERSVPLSTTAMARARAVQASCDLARGDAASTRRILLAALDTAERAHDLESTALLVGNAALMLAAMGRLREARSVGDKLARVPLTGDWYAFRSLAELVDYGNRWLVDQDAQPPSRAHVAAEGRVNLERLFATRAEVLRREAQGLDPDDEPVTETLRMLVDQRKHLWAALFVLELSSLTTARGVHEQMWSVSQRFPRHGLVAVAGATARARLDGDGRGLLRSAVDLERSGLHALALRVAADAARLLPPHTAGGKRARAAVLRGARQYDGLYLRSLQELDSLPTPRQMEVAWRVAEGASATGVAEELVLSTRTVENHLHRVYRALHLHGRDELTEVLLKPVRPADWRFGDFVER